MAVYSTPGVYFEWLDPPRGITTARTDIAGFVGIAERGPLHTPVRVESWTQFTTRFGGYISTGYLAYAVKGFFSNGGVTCYVVRVADPDWAQAAAIDLVTPGGGPRLRLQASSPGSWAHKMIVRVVLASDGRFTLSLTLPDGPQEIWRDLTLLDAADSRFAVRALTPENARNHPPGRRVNPVDSLSGSQLVTASLLKPGDPPAKATLALDAPVVLGRPAGGQDGLWTLRPEHLNSALGDSGQLWGLATLEEVGEVAIVAMPDLVPAHVPPPLTLPETPDCSNPCEPALPELPEEAPDLPPLFDDIQQRALRMSLVNHCERLKDRVALLDPPPDLVDPQQVAALLADLGSSYAALYFPWLLVPDPVELDGLLRAAPPCGHVAGIYARVENTRGVHKPPANEPMQYAQDVAVAVDDAVHGFLNDRHVNVFRMNAARGLRIMGARTTLVKDPAWRYVNVRRLLLMIERGIRIDAQWLPFEPNNPELWREVDRVLRTFLDDLWRRGMLDGATAQEAYSVQCDAGTNPPELTDEGRLIAVIGVQPPIPAEFVIVRIGQTDSGLQFFEER